MIDGNTVDCLHALLIGCAPFGGNGFESGSNTGETCDHVAEIVAGDAHQLDVIKRRASSGPHTPAEKADFAEVVAAREIREDQLAPGIVLRNLYKSYSNEIEAVGRCALLNDGLAGSEALQLDAFLEVVNKIRREVREHGHAAQMVFKSAPAIGLVKLRPKRFILEHDVENIAQHFKRNDVRLRYYRGRARIKIHASHFAEEIAGPKLGHGIAVGEIDGSVDGNRSVAHFLFALVFFARNKRAGQPLEKSFCSTMRLDVRDGAGNGDFTLAFENIESCGAEFTFAANDLTSMEATFDDRAAIEFEERTGDAFENRNLQEILGPRIPASPDQRR